MKKLIFLILFSPFVALAAGLIIPQGGTGQSNFQSGSIPYGVTGALRFSTTTVATNGQILAWLNGVPKPTATTTFSTGLTFSAGNVTCDTASGSVFGCLSSADWTTFNGKQASGNYLTALGSGYASTTGTTITHSTTTSTTNGLTSALAITATAGALNFTPSLSGTLAIAGGGTNSSSLGSQSLMFFNGTSIVATSSSPLYVTTINATGTTASTLPYASTTAVTFTTASTTNLTVSSVASALYLGSVTGAVGAYGGTSCTNQFARSLNGAGAATCATVSASDVSLANLTATDGSLTFSGTYNGSTARTIGITSIAANSVLGNISGATAVPSAVATSSLFTGTLGQSAYFSGTGTLVGTSTLFFANGLAGGGSNPTANVGIGTTTPIDRLQIQGANGVNAFGVANTAGTDVFDARPSSLGAGIFDFANSTGGVVASIRGDTGVTFFASGGNFGIGISGPVANFQATNSTANATTTIELGQTGQNKGTCMKMYDETGAAAYLYVKHSGGAPTLSVSTTACASVVGF